MALIVVLNIALSRCILAACTISQMTIQAAGREGYTAFM